METKTTELRAVWNSLENGDIVRSREFQELCSEGATTGAVGAYLHFLYKKGAAKRSGEKMKYTYEKLQPDSTVEYKRRSRNVREYAKEQEVRDKLIEEKFNQIPAPKITLEHSTTQLGESVLKIVEKLRTENKDLKQEMKQLVEEKAELERLYRKAQERISELNSNGASKTFDLHKLQQAVQA